MTLPRPSVTVFGSWRSAFTWAYHVARTGRSKTQVAKLDGRWCAWRVSPPPGPRWDRATERYVYDSVSDAEVSDTADKVMT